MRRALISILAAMPLLMACDNGHDFLGMVYTRSDSPDERFETSMKYNESQGDIVIEAGDNAYRLYVASDAHISDATANLDRFVKDKVDDVDAAPFALYLGDMADSVESLDIFRQRVEPITLCPTDRLFTTPGNHDIYFGHWSEFAERFNTSVYTFKVHTPSDGIDLYVCLDSANGTLGAKQRAWLESVLTEADSAGYRRIVVFTHTHLFKLGLSSSPASAFPLEETYFLTDLFAKHHVSLVLQGHDHTQEEMVYRDVKYLKTNALEISDKPASYAVITISRDSMEVEVRPV